MKKTNNTQDNAKKALNWIDNQFAISGVKNYSDSCCFFNLYTKSPIGNVAIYGCRVVSGEKGNFISFPAEKYTAKDGGEAWHNHASVNFSDGMTMKIIKAVESMIE